MELTVTGEDTGLTEEYVAWRVERLKRLFCSEPEVNVSFDTEDSGRVVAEVVVPVKGYHTLRARSKGEDARTSLDKAVKKLEWKYKLFWTRGSFRFGDCC